MTQTLRDAEVLGNGYLVLPTSPDEGPYNLRPEHVEILLGERFTVLREGRAEPVEAPVMHHRGVEQFDSPYGYSVLEPVLPEWVSRLTLQKVRRTLRQ